MKIVQIIPSFNVGGGELLAVRLCAEILRQHPEHQVFLISLYDPIPTVVYDEALSSGVKILTLGKNKGFDYLTHIRMFKILNFINPDVIHTHLAGLRYSVFSAIFLKSAVKVHTIHNIASKEVYGIVRIVHKFAFNIFGWLPVALSKKIKKSVLELYNIDAPIVMNGISVKEMPSLEIQKNLKRSFSLPEDIPIIITIGRLCVQKNQALLLEAFRIISEKLDCRLLIVGEDAMGGRYEKALQDQLLLFPEHVRSKVLFLGSRKDVQDLLSISDVFVLSSDWEGVPLTLLEAMGNCIPTVCTSVGGIPDVIDHARDGLLVPCGDSEKLAGAILNILHGDINVGLLVNNALEKFKNLYSIEQSANGYLKIYHNILEMNN